MPFTIIADLSTSHPGLYIALLVWSLVICFYNPHFTSHPGILTLGTCTSITNYYYATTCVCTFPSFILGSCSLYHLLLLFYRWNLLLLFYRWSLFTSHITFPCVPSVLEHCLLYSCFSLCYAMCVCVQCLYEFLYQLLLWTFICNMAVIHFVRTSDVVILDKAFKMLLI